MGVPLRPIITIFIAIGMANGPSSECDDHIDHMPTDLLVGTSPHTQRPYSNPTATATAASAAVLKDDAPDGCDGCGARGKIDLSAASPHPSPHLTVCFCGGARVWFQRGVRAWARLNQISHDLPR